MKKYWKRGAFAAVAVVLAIVLATPAMAIISTGRSEQMVFQSTCDKAGTLELKFTKDDIAIMAEYLSDVNTPKLDATYMVNNPGASRGTANYVLVEVSLGSLNITQQVNPAPTLCKDIKGDTSTFEGAAGDDLPHPDELIPLQVLAQEVSDVTQNALTAGPGVSCDDDAADVTAYVWGEEGATKFFIYITDIADNVPGTGAGEEAPWDDQNKWPWIKVGLDENQIGGICDPDDGHHTTICADVSGYADADNLATLNVSLDITPENLTYTTSDSQIGHFDPYQIALLDCPVDKGNTQGCDEVDSKFIELCPLEDPEQDDCVTYYKCIQVSGLTLRDDYKFTLRTNGATNGANEQEGVYLTAVNLYQGDDLLPYYMPGSGDDMQRMATFYATASGDYDDRVTDTDCTYLAEYFQTVILEGNIDPLQTVKICIAYQVQTTNEPMPEIGENVDFWITVATANYCETALFDGTFEGALVVECGQLESCMYFPYVIVDYAPWATGIVVTNLSEDVAFEDMNVAVQLFDRNGDKYVGSLPDSIVTGKVFSFQIDQMVTAMEWDVPSGPAWLWVTGNFPIDGYSFLTDGSFGGSTLPRVLDECDILDMR